MAGRHLDKRGNLEGFRRRAVAGGYWKKFLKVQREVAEARGVSKYRAWREAAEKFPETEEEAGLPGAVRERAERAREEREEREAWKKPKEGKLKGTLKKSLFAGRGMAAAKEIIEWVFENLYIEDVTPADAPCAGAWGWRLELKAARVMRQDFFRNIWPRLLPSKAEQDMEARYADDGRRLDERIAGLLKKAEEEAAVA